MPDVLVEVSTIVFLLMSSLLAAFLTREYLSRRQKSYLYWSAGLWLFALSDLLEVLFAFGAYSQPMAQAYLFLSAFIAIPLAMGSLELIKSVNVKHAYLAYSVVTTLLLMYFTFTASIGSIVTNSVVNGNVPMNVIIYSSLITFPALIVIIATAALSFVRTRKKKLLWIILGILTFGASGTLYIASVPVVMYYAEFLGLVMLWLGFYDFGALGGAKRKAH